MSVFSDVIDVLAELALAAKLADKSLQEVGDQQVFDIPDAGKVNALLLKGKSGRRYRLDGVRLTREK